MKKILIAALALTLTLSVASCGDTAESAADETTTTTTTAAAAGEEESEAETEADAESEAEEVTETEAAATEAPEEAESEAVEEVESAVEEAESEAEADATEGKIYSVEADAANWETSEDAFGNTTITYKGTDVANAADLCTVIINADSLEGLETYTMEELAPLFKDSMGLGDSFVVSSEEAGKFNGYESYTYTGVYTVGSMSFDLKVIIVKDGTNLLVVVPMSYNEVTESMQGEFQKVLDTIKIK